MPDQQTAARRVMITLPTAMGKTEQFVGVMEMALDLGTSPCWETVPTPYAVSGTLKDMHITSYGRKMLGMAPARPRASKGWRRHIRQQKARKHG